MKKLIIITAIIGFCTMLLPVQAEVITLTDNFDVSHDYVTSGVTGTIWDGILNSGNALVMNTTSSPGQLTISAASGSQWGWGVWNAPMLYINASGDFDASVTVTDSNMGINWWKASLMACADGSNDNLMQIQLVSPVDYDRTNGADWKDGSSVGAGQAGGEGNYWTPFSQMRMVRTSNSFQMYVRNSDAEEWTTYGFGPMVRDDLDGVGVKIGLSFETGDGAISNAHFENFSVALIPEPVSMMLLCGGGVLTLLFRRKK